MEIPNTSFISNIENQQKTRNNENGFHDKRMQEISYQSGMTFPCSTQMEIPVIDLTIDTPSENNELSRNRVIDVIDVDNLPNNLHSSEPLEFFEPFSFESLIDLSDMFVLGHSLTQRQTNHSGNSIPHTRRITRQMVNQMHRWGNQILQTSDNFLHLLMNHITTPNHRRTNSSLLHSRNYPYYIRSRQNSASTSLEYDHLFSEENDDILLEKDTPLAPFQYKKPPDTAKGFTRSLNRSQKLVCPNCIHELGVSEDSLKKTIWIGKCGHVYCGSCAMLFRSMKAKGPHSAICVVKHCYKVITGKHNLREIYV